jgi:hypothetical protein
MSDRLPPPLLVSDLPAGSDRDGDVVRPVSVEDGALARAYAFGRLLADGRRSRGLLDGPLSIFAAADASTAPPPAPAGQMWVPHVFCWERPDAPALAWELCAKDRLEALLGSGADAVGRWAARPSLLLRLAALAGAASARPRSAEHLSLRWILAHEAQVAELLSAGVVGIDHVSLHVAVDEEERVLRALTEALGLVEIPRPASISVPGRWLQAGTARVHLNSRTARAGEEGFPGTAPNHVCFAVGDLAAAERRLAALGFETRRAGSLGAQAWFRLASGTVIELQPRRS